MTTPYMGLDLPVVSSTPGPTYATENNTAFTTIDSHDHTTGKGVPISPTAMNINADLEFNSHNATELRSTRFDSQSAALATGSDKGQLYNLSGNPTWNDNAGTATRILNTSYPFVVGDIPYASSTTAIGKLAIGSNGQILKVSGGVPTWQSNTSGFVSSTQSGATFTASVTVDLYLCNPSTTQGITLPASTGSGHAFLFKKLNNTFDAITITRSGADVIVDASGNVNSTTLNTIGEEIEMVDVSAGVWQIVNRRIPSITVATTVNVSAGFGTISTASGFIKRMGDSAYFNVLFTAGTCAGSLATFTLPTGITINSSKITINNNSSGSGSMIGQFVSSGKTGGTGPVVTATATSTGGVFFGDIQGSASNLIPKNGNNICSDASVFSFFFTIPVNGWNG